jgi:hypothetical protein
VGCFIGATQNLVVYTFYFAAGGSRHSSVESSEGNGAFFGFFGILAGAGGLEISLGTPLALMARTK